jgi:hypothetical protein
VAPRAVKGQVNQRPMDSVIRKSLETTSKEAETESYFRSVEGIKDIENRRIEPGGQDWQ